MQKKRFLLAGICDSQTTFPAAPGDETKRHEPPLDEALAEKSIDGVKHIRRAGLLRTETPQRANRNRTVKCCRASLPAAVTQGYAQILRPVTNEVIQVAAEFAGGDHPRGDLQTKLIARQS